MSAVLNLMPGDWVEVRSPAEILATLDAQGCLDRLPFMPEMLAYCGKRFRVHKRADKTCDLSSEQWGLRRMTDTVFLALLRCTGEAHGGCQAGCSLFWKEAWLKRVSADNVTPGHSPSRPAPSGEAAGAASDPAPGSAQTGGPCLKITDLDQLEQTTRRNSPAGAKDTWYRCQATEVGRATARLPWWDIRQYRCDIHNG